MALTLGHDEAVEQLRNAMALGIDRAILLETDGEEWDPVATARAILDAVHAQWAEGTEFDLLLFGNEAADSGDYQVGIRVARALDRPCVTGVKGIELQDDAVEARREGPGGWEVFRIALPAVLTLKEGINLPRYPSIPGRLRAKKKPVERTVPEWRSGGLEKVRLKLPSERESEVEVLGTGAEAAPRVVEILKALGLVRA